GFWNRGLSPGRLGIAWRRALVAGLRRPTVAIMLALTLPAAGFVAAGSLGQEFFPPVDRDLFQVQVWLPNEAPIERTDAAIASVEETILDQPGAERVAWLVGGSFPTVYYNLVMNRDATPSYAQGIVRASSEAAAKAMIEPLQRRLDQDFPGLQAVVRQFGQGPPVASDIELRLFGPDVTRLQDLGETVRRVLQSHPEVSITRSSLPRGEPKLWFSADEDEARLAGLSLGDLAAQLRVNLDGAIGGTLVEDTERLPVRVRYGDERSELDRVATMPVTVPGGDRWSTLTAFGSLDLRPEPGAITRYDGERTHVLRAWTTHDALPIDVTAAVLGQLDSDDFTLPPGYRLEVGGAAAEDAEAKAGLAASVPVLATLMTATLVLVFGSIRLALLLFGVAGASVGLGLLSTSLIGFPVSFNSILGTLGLIGVALNDSIVVLAAIRAHPSARAGQPTAVAEQVLGTTRHVLSTTLTTVGGFLPLLLFVGGDFWPSLAIVLAGGIVGGSILALVLIPAAYIVLHRPRRSIGWKPARALAVALAALFATGCVVGPDYVAPKPTTAADFAATTEASVVALDRADATSAPDPDAAWWQALGDATLTGLIDDALAANLDLAVASARVDTSRAARGAISSRGRPSLDTDASAMRSRASETTPDGALASTGLADLESSRYGLGLSAAWEVDLFGGVRRSIEAADAQVDVAIESRRGVLLAVVAEVARTYTMLRGDQRRLALVEKNIRLLDETRRRVVDLHRVGLGSRLDAERATAQWQTTRASAAPLRLSVRAAAHRLAVLTGRQPDALLDRLLASAPPIEPPDLVPVGLPSELLRRRPDVRAAERRLAASTATLGVATADLYPRFFLSGRAGTASSRFADVFDAVSRTWSLGPSISWPIFQGGRLRAGVAAAEAELTIAEAEYRHSVLRAVEDVETALVAYAEEELRRRALTDASAASREAADKARIVYDRGLDDFLTVLDAERTLTSTEDALAVAETGVVLRLIDLYAALGGGWQVAESADAARFEVAELGGPSGTLGIGDVRGGQ
ncbi:MAG: efflux transporter outer membrane subunit, partial [Acidobacteriota bacterium]